ncbi:hypothetical protein [Sphingomonas bacterium]|uniref:hypothetical protein n=1 Tax=Sphingomonas bacterium TaxID=1895847 RepID=UPI0020C6B813|nr:hypothetical protein [Sphingomonas bacterium]
MPIDPNSLMMTSALRIAGSRTSVLSSVVLPLPRNPVSRETGIVSFLPRVLMDKTPGIQAASPRSSGPISCS